VNGRPVTINYLAGEKAFGKVAAGIILAIVIALKPYAGYTFSSTFLVGWCDPTAN